MIITTERSMRRLAGARDQYASRRTSGLTIGNLFLLFFFLFFFNLVVLLFSYHLFIGINSDTVLFKSFLRGVGVPL